MTSTKRKRTAATTEKRHTARTSHSAHVSRNTEGRKKQKHKKMRGAPQVYCRVGAKTRAVDFDLEDTVGVLKERILGTALNDLGADQRLVRACIAAFVSPLPPFIPPAFRPRPPPLPRIFLLFPQQPVFSNPRCKRKKVVLLRGLYHPTPLSPTCLSSLTPPSFPFLPFPSLPPKQNKK